jgi:hypothetical protein
MGCRFVTKVTTRADSSAIRAVYEWNPSPFARAVQAFSPKMLQRNTKGH